MTDLFSKTKRSQIMAAVKSSRNKTTELKLATILRRNKLSGWRRNFTLPGKPDFVFPKIRLAVFIDGCFWHGCPKHLRKPKDNAKYWRKKILRYRTRDRLVTKLLRHAGWRVMRIWEHELKSEVQVVTRFWKLRCDGN